MRVAAVLTMALLLAACGGGTATDAGGDYDAEVQRACTWADEAFSAIGPRTGEAGIAAAADEWAEVVRRLGRVKPPEARRQEHARMLEEARKLEPALRRTAANVGTGGRAEALAETIVRTRSAADSVKVAADVMKVPGCGVAAVAAADRLLTRAYATELRFWLREYRKVMRRVEFDAPPQRALASARSLADAMIELEVGTGALEPPAAVAEPHGRMIDLIDPVRTITLTLDVRTEKVGPARAVRMLHGAERHVRRLERAQRTVLAATERALRSGLAGSQTGAG